MGKVLAWAVEDFKSRGIEPSRLDAELLLSHVLKVDRLALYTGFDRPLEEAELSAYRQMIIRRRSFEPLAYITGEKEFWSLSFQVNPSVLIPRPDTETLVEAALSRMAETGRALDLCTGSGCVAAAVASEKQGWTVDAVDISKDALAVAKKNIDRLKLSDRVRLLEGDLFFPLGKNQYNIITANPPYVQDDEISALQQEVQREPRCALAGGKDGLNIVRRIVEQAPSFLFPGGFLLIEIDPRQTKALLLEIGPRFFKIPGEVISDLSNTPRVAVLKNNATA